MRLTLDLDPRDRTSVRLVETHAFAAGDVYSPLILRDAEGTDPQTLRVFLRRALPGGSLVTVSRTEHPFAAISRLDRQGSMSLSTREMADWCGEALGSGSDGARLPNIVADGVLEIFDSARLVCRARVPVILRELSPGLLPGQDGRDASVSVERNLAGDGVTVTAVSGDGTVTRADVYDCRLPDVDPYPVQDSDSDSPRMALVVSDGVARAVADAEARSAAALAPVAASAASASEAASAAMGKAGAAESAAGALSVAVATLRTGLSSESTARQAADAALSARLSALEGSDSDASVRDIARSEVAAVVDGAPEAFDTLREIAEWMESEGDAAAALAGRVAALESAGAEANVQADWSESDPESDAFIRNRPSIPAKMGELENDSGFLTRAEAGAGFTEWTLKDQETGGVVTYDGLPVFLSYDEYSAGEWGWHPAVRDRETGDIVGLGRYFGDGESVSLSWAGSDDWSGDGGFTATRVRLPTMADLALKADKGEMSVTAGTGADADRTTIQLKAGTGATVLTQHQQLQARFTDWAFAAEDGSNIPSDLRLILTDEGWVPASDSYGYPLGAGGPLGDGSSTALTWSLGSSPFGEFSATRAVAGYVLGSQTTKPLQPQGDYLTEHQSLAGLMPKYAFDEAAVAQTGGWTFSGTPAGTGYHWEVAFSDGTWSLYSVDDSDETQKTLLNSMSGAASDVSLEFVFYDEDNYDVVATRGYVLTVSPYTAATYTAMSTAKAFEIAVGALPTGVTGMMRDCILVIDCTATGAVAPTVTWDTHFHPRTDTATDLAIVEAGKRAVFYISEYTSGEFAVGGWVETEGGSGT